MPMENHDAIRLEAQKLMSGDRGSHGWDHVERVWILCSHIGSIEGADLDILEIAAYLHDIGRAQEKASGGKVCHARVGGDMAKEILQARGYEENFVEQVVHCISTHRFRDRGKAPESLEARVLFDADKLDSIGAVGIGRAFLFAGEVGARLHNPEADIMNTKAYTQDDTAFREFSVKLKRIKDRMLTETGKRIAESRHRFMEEFFERLDEEVRGRK